MCKAVLGGKAVVVLLANSFPYNGTELSVLLCIGDPMFGFAFCTCSSGQVGFSGISKD